MVYLLVFESFSAKRMVFVLYRKTKRGINTGNEHAECTSGHLNLLDVNH